MKYLDSHHILCDQQHSFRKRQLCDSQLITTVHDLASQVDKRQQINAILLGFSMAFDKWLISALLSSFTTLEYGGRQQPGLEGIKLFSCSSQLSTKFQMLISIKISRNSASGSDKVIQLFFLLTNMKMPTIFGILIFMSRKNSMLS